MHIKPVKIGNSYIGPGQPCFFVSEIGINHNGNLNIAKKLIDIAKKAGSNAVKFQKRDINLVYDKETLSSKLDKMEETYEIQLENLKLHSQIKLLVVL